MDYILGIVSKIPLHSWRHEIRLANKVLLKSFAKENRRYLTEAESALWKYLKGNALGHKFLRQHIIGDYIVNFFSRDELLVI